MSWLLEHIQLLIVVAGIIAYWLNQRHREKQGSPADYDEDGTPENRPTQAEFNPSTMDADEADRTKRVMEELRRKREQRSGAGAAPAKPVPSTAPAQPARSFDAPPPVFEDPMAQMMKQLAKRFAPEPESRPEEDDSAVLERQRKLEAKIAALEEQKKATLRKAASISAQTQAETQTMGERAIPQLPDLLASLSDPLAIRRAIVLNEVLGKPVGLR
jgi:hypothetical protein